ncbi:MAG: DNA gyrase subunit A [Myxococcota bacterium]|nr:DNA gyrase subunit A [Myxococcota bacterium]
MDQSAGADSIASNLEEIDIEQEMRSSYLDYSMSVIIGRALPDVRDGLKPVHRRILYAMLREGNLSNRRYSKCAGVVGEVLKKYHPHGDSAVYDALVRMAQPWNMRAPLVDGQGNFGSVDGDPAAAYRYTECRMQKLAEFLLLDIDKDTVNFGPNFDGATEEPLVLPAAYPNLLVNGSDGIAVGMATRIPPHNLGEIINGTVALIDNPEITTEELMEIIPAPDFPTAGTIYGRAGVKEAYSTGRGKILLRGNATFEDISGGRSAIIIDELPYQVNKARLVEEIANLVKSKRIEGISALRDESDRSGMRVVVELKRDTVREVMLNRLFKHTALQNTYGVILLAIVNNRPVVLTLREALQHYISHRRDVTIRRCRFELRKALARQHILAGYLIALDNIDEVISIIRSSPDSTTARERLTARFELSPIQAQAILDMRLQRLTGLERQKIEDEYNDLEEIVVRLHGILNNESRLMEVIKEELIAVRDKFANPRRTKIIDASGKLSILDLIAEEEQVVTLSMRGYIKRSSMEQYQEQRRGGFGRRGMKTRDQDSIQDLFIANTLSVLLVFTTQGQLFKVPVYEIPETSRDSRGTPIVNLVHLENNDKIAAVLSIEDFDEEVDLLFCSRKGLVKRTSLGDYRNIRRTGLRAYDCAEGDELFTVVKTSEGQDFLILTRNGKSIRIPYHYHTENEEGERVIKVDEDGEPIMQIRHTGRVARGVRGINMQDGDEIADMRVVNEDPDLLLLTITENGYGKRTRLEEYRQQNRGGQGIIDIVTGERNGRVAGAAQVADGDRIMMITDTGRVIKTPVTTIRIQGRNTKGVTLMRVEGDERIVSVARVVESEAEVEE